MIMKREINAGITLPYYETEGNVCWFHDLNWCFAREEYEVMVKEFLEKV